MADSNWLRDRLNNVDVRRATLDRLGYAEGGEAEDDDSGMIQLGKPINKGAKLPPPPPPRYQFQDPIAGYLGQSAEQMARGWHGLWDTSGNERPSGPEFWNKRAQAASDVIRGAAPFAAPLAIPAAAAAPATALTGLAAGLATTSGVESLAQKAGVPSGEAALLGDISGLAGGEMGGAAAPAVSDLVGRVRALDLSQVPGTMADYVNRLDPATMAGYESNPERGSLSPKAPRVENAAGKNVRGTMGGAKGTVYVPLPEDVQALAAKLQPDTPDAAVREAAATLKWNNWDKPAAERLYGPLVRSKPTDTKLARLQNTPERVQQRIQEARDYLAQPGEVWVPKDYGIFDRSLIQQAMNGFPDVAQTPFPRAAAPRADMSFIDEIYNDPVNRDLIKQFIARGLRQGGDTWYASLYPVKAEAVSRNLTSPYFPHAGGDLFDNWVYSITPGSARNAVYNERAVGNFLRNLYTRGIPIAPTTPKLHNPYVIQEMEAFARRNGMGLPLMPVHAAGAARVLEQGISPLYALQNNLVDSYKIPTYGVQTAGNFAHSWTGDVHEARGETLASRFHPYFHDQGGFGKNEYGPAERHMLAIGNEMGLVGGPAQAGRWFGGGGMTGLLSPLGDALDLYERQIAYTLHHKGQSTDPMTVRNYFMKLMQEGGDVLPWQSNDLMPDHRQLR